MKKYFLLTMLVIGVLALSACSGGGAQSTPIGTEGVPNTGGFATETFPTEAVGTTSGLATSEPTTGTGLSTSVATESTLGTSPAVGTSVATSPAVGTSVGAVPTTQSTSSIPTTGSFQTALLSNMMKYHVQDENGNDLGQVVDYVVNVCEAHIAYIAVNANSAANGNSSTVAGTATPGNNGGGNVTSNGAASGNVILIPYEANSLNIAAVNNIASGTAVANGTSVPSTGSTSATSTAPDTGDVIVVNLGGADLSTFPAVSMSALRSSDVSWEANVLSFWGPYVKQSLTTACSVPANSGTAVPGGTVEPTLPVTDMMGGTPVAAGTSTSGVASPTRTSDRVTVNKVAMASDLLKADLTEGNGRLFGKMRDAVVIRNTGGFMYYIVQAVAGNQQGIGNNGGGNTVGTAVPSGTQTSPSTQNNSATGGGISNSNAAGLIALPPGAVMVRNDAGKVSFYLLVPANVAVGGPAFSGDYLVFDTSMTSNWFTYWQQYLPMTQSQLP